MPTPSQASDIVVVPPPEDHVGEKVELPLYARCYSIVIRLAEDLEQSKLAASHTDFHSANHERLVGYPQSTNKTGSGGTDISTDFRAQKTAQHFTFKLAVKQS